jgi:hypothetical protein
MGWSKDYLREAQDQCPDLAQVKNWLLTDVIPYKADGTRWSHKLRAYNAVRLALLDGLIYRKVKLAYMDDATYQVALSNNLRCIVLKYSHNHLQSGHQGENNTAHILRRRFYLPNYRKLS